MAYELVWTAEAEDDFKAIVLYLKENWSIQTPNKFEIDKFRSICKILITRINPLKNLSPALTK